MLLRNIEPFTRQVLTSTLSSKFESDVYHELRTSDCRLFYILKGNGNIKIENKIYPLHQGCAVLFKSGTKYEWRLDENGIRAIFINFDYTMNFSNRLRSFHPIHSEKFSEHDILEKIVFEDANVLNFPIYIKNATSVESNLKLLASEFYLNSNYTQEYLSVCLKFVIISLVRLAEFTETPKKKNDFELVKKVVHYIENNYYMDLSNDTIGEHFCFNPSYLNRIFKENTGQTLHSFLFRYRMNLAMDLLHTTNFPVWEIVTNVGFSDIPHFIKSFKKWTGQTPTEYRHKSRNPAETTTPFPLGATED